MLGITFLEGIFMFGAFAYVGAELHQRFGLSLGVVGAMLAVVRRRRAALRLDGRPAWSRASASRA